MKPEELAERLEAADDFLNDPNKFAISRTLRDAILSSLRRVATLEAALRRLADAADFYGLNNLDTDDLDEVATELQDATLAARAALTGEA